MRVLHVHSGNIFGGIESMLVTLAHECQHQEDGELHVALCYDGRLARALRAGGAVVSMLGEVRLSRPATARRARAALRERLDRTRVDVVVMHLPWTQLIFGAVAKRAGCPLVLWVHGPATGWTCRAAALHRPAAILCNSAFTAASLPGTYGAIPHVIVHCPSAPPAGSDDKSRARVRRELGARDDDVVVVQVSRLDPWKGHEIHLRALARLREVPGWVLWLVGGAQRGTETHYLDALRSLAADLAIAGRVLFLGDRDDVPRLLAAADVYCQPNTAPEPFGLSYVEALGAGLPVIASNAGGATEIVTPDTGVLVPPCDVEGVEEALRGLILDRSRRERLGRNGPARAAALCDPARQVRLMNEVLRGVARSAP